MGCILNVKVYLILRVMIAISFMAILKEDMYLIAGATNNKGVFL